MQVMHLEFIINLLISNSALLLENEQTKIIMVCALVQLFFKASKNKIYKQTLIGMSLLFIESTLIENITSTNDLEEK